MDPFMEGDKDPDLDFLLIFSSIWGNISGFFEFYLIIIVSLSINATSVLTDLLQQTGRKQPTFA